MNNFLYRFSAFNIFMGFLLSLAFFQGWIQQVYQTDITHLTSVIVVIFLIGLGIAYRRAFLLNAPTSAYQISLGKTNEIREQRMSASLDILHHIANVLLLIGIAGTLTGVIIALRGTESLTTGTDMSQAVLGLFKGVYIKLYISLTGIIFHIWTLTNYHLLSTRSDYVLADLHETLGL